MVFVKCVIFWGEGGKKQILAVGSWSCMTGQITLSWRLSFLSKIKRAVNKLQYTVNWNESESKLSYHLPRKIYKVTQVTQA